MPMMCVRKMRVSVLDAGMLMPMAMFGPWRNRISVLMRVMCIMSMLMVMLEFFVRMRMFVAFGQVQPDTCCHQESGAGQLHGQRFPCRKGQNGSEKGRDRKIRPGSRSAEMAKRHDEQRQANAIGKKAKRHGSKNNRTTWQGCAKRSRQRQICKA